MHLMQHCMAGLIPRYRALAERGQIELSMTPYCHPIVPLLNDFANMRDALPDAPAPQAADYPGGAARSRWHLQHGAEVFQRYFGARPAGVWLSEGGVSEDALALLDEMDFAWTASGEGVWRSSCAKSGCGDDDTQTKRGLFAPAKIDGYRTRVFFRDDGLSDLIGFKYSDWHADDAVGDFVQHLENIAGFFGQEAGDHVVPVILDGENAWEYYPDNGHYFLDALYAALSARTLIRPGTFAEQAARAPARPMARLAAGSWVYGSFSTWIGSEDKNRGWDYLVAAKQAFDAAVASGRLSAEQAGLAARQLAVCEGSDWFWWFGDYNPADSVSDFEQLYRVQLRELYRLIGVAPPALLDVPLSQGGGWAENAGTMRRNVG
jgi:alpha-amylase/alpha-mannosidase (GH57 family)